ncbi:MAG: hypothetical protein ACRC3J_05600 [Culicoidibacterales bacterium]
MIRYEPNPPAKGNELYVIPYVDVNDTLPLKEQMPISWVRNGEWLGAATTPTLNDGELNRVTVMIQKNVKVLDINTKLNKSSIDDCIRLVNIHEDILNAGGIDLPLYERVGKIELDVGKIGSLETYRTVREELLHQKTMMGNYKNEDLDGDEAIGRVASGMKKIIEAGAETIVAIGVDLETVKEDIGTAGAGGTGIKGKLTSVELDIYGAGSGRPSTRGSLLAKVSGTGTGTSYDNLGCYLAGREIYEDYKTNGFLNDLKFGHDKDVSYTRATVGDDMKQSWVPVGSLPIKLTSVVKNAKGETILEASDTTLIHGNDYTKHVFNGIVTHTLEMDNDTAIKFRDSVGNPFVGLNMTSSDILEIGVSNFPLQLNTSDDVTINANGVRTKIWCDANAEAPKDGQQYVRKDGDWAKLDKPTYGTDAPNNDDGFEDGHIYFQLEV